MRVRLGCADKHEAQKLASLVFQRERDETFVSEVINVIGNEVIVALKDGSAHSIMLRDICHVEAFVDFIQSVTEGIHGITGSVTLGSDVELTKA